MPSLHRSPPWRDLFLALIVVGMAAASALAAPEPRHSPGGREHAEHAGRWYDNAHSHARYYPAVGYRVRAVPPHAHAVVWGGAHYHFAGGVWYSPWHGGHVVVRPPFGLVVGELPLWRTVVVAGGLTYFYLNGTYYREHPRGGYEVVAAPAHDGGALAQAEDKVFIYPRQNQTGERQASDEYECHRWAVGQSGFDPVAAVSGTASDPARRGDYRRAQSACLEARGYTVR